MTKKNLNLKKINIFLIQIKVVKHFFVIETSLNCYLLFQVTYFFKKYGHDHGTVIFKALKSI